MKQYKILRGWFLTRQNVEVEKERTLDGSSEIKRVGSQPHCVGETKNVTTFDDDVMNAG